MTKEELFTDTFEITDIDAMGKKFDRVSRINANSLQRDIQLTLDVNTEIYPMKPPQKFELVLTTTLSTDGALQDKESWRENLAKHTLADDYEYVMFGKVYKFDESGGSKSYVAYSFLLTCRSVYASFGGLLMCLAGDYRALQEMNVGQDLYLLIRK